ncbi:MAG: glycosyl transferase family 2 [Bacteroidales bacterium]|nr:glycosyl transferase family 2 [Bacteroidales bacterium]
MQGHNIGIVIQARTGSTRLPQKMIMPFYKNQSILEIVLKKLTELKLPIIVATTANKSDNIIENISHKLGIRVHRGEVDNVLKRMIDAAKLIEVKSVVRVCADNPFLNIRFLTDLISFYISKSPDYASFSLENNLPVIKSHQGFWAEIVKLSALEKVLTLTSDKIYLEHVTNFIYSNHEIFNIKFIKAPDYLYNKNEIRLTIDTKEDFQLSGSLYKKYIENDKFADINNFIEYIDQSAEIIQIMKNEIRKNTK